MGTMAIYPSLQMQMLMLNRDTNLEGECSSLTDETQPPYIGEAACTTFASRLLQYLRGNQSPPPPLQFHYHRYKLSQSTNIRDRLPSRACAHFLVKAMLGFMYAFLNPSAAQYCMLISYQWT
jgi:hypothetical protein